MPKCHIMRSMLFEVSPADRFSWLCMLCFTVFFVLFFLTVFLQWRWCVLAFFIWWPCWSVHTDPCLPLPHSAQTLLHSVLCFRDSCQHTVWYLTDSDRNVHKRGNVLKIQSHYVQLRLSTSFLAIWLAFTRGGKKIDTSYTAIFCATILYRFIDTKYQYFIK